MAASTSASLRVVSSGSLCAVRRRDDCLEQRVGPGQLEDTARGRADRVDQGVRVPVEGRVDDGEELRKLGQHHLLGEVGLGADLVVDRLPRDADPVGELAHRHAGPADLQGQRRRGRHHPLVRGGYVDGVGHPASLGSGTWWDLGHGKRGTNQ